MATLREQITADLTAKRVELGELEAKLTSLPEHLLNETVEQLKSWFTSIQKHLP